MYHNTDDLRIRSRLPLLPPALLLSELRASERATEVVTAARKDAAAILAGKDDRLLVIVGPCSVHDPKAAMEYAHLLLKEARKHTEDLLIVMRVYFEKPRTTVGWKGLINDPQIDGSFRINDGLRLGRRLLADLLAYLTGEAYEGAFRRVHASGPQTDLDAATADAVGENTVARVLVHFFFKIVLADPTLLDTDLGLAPDTVAAMRAWMQRWPSPTFAESRHGFVYGRLPRFAAAFTADVRHQLGLASGAAHQPHAQEH